MTPFYYLYKTGTSLLYLLYPFAKLHSNLTGKSKEILKQRLGSYPDSLKRSIRGVPRIWLHAASVGEVSVAHAIYIEIQKMLPFAHVVVSTTTETGQEFAQKIFCKKVNLIYAPVDTPLAVSKAMLSVKPDIMAFVETEIWPNWIACAHKKGIPIVLVNGRVSVRSFGKYIKIKSLIKDILNKFDCLSMIHADDAKRISKMGALPEKIKIHGNAKFDILIRQNKTKDAQMIRQAYSLRESDVVFVAGSIRQKEGEIILKAYQSILQNHPEVLLFIAPRHIERSHDIAQTARSMGFECQFRSDFDGGVRKRRTPVVIIDIIGELSSIYGVSTLNFCGGSLAPLGGQNILEAVAWGKPVFYGPHMHDFQEARDLIEEAVGDAFLINDGEQLVQKAIDLLNDPQKGKTLGQKSMDAILKNTGAAGKHAQELMNVLELKNRTGIQRRKNAEF